jgi:hypothetical protein
MAELEDVGVSPEDADIFFQDEAAFGLMNEPKRCWVKGERPTVPCQTIRECTYAYAAANPFIPICNLLNSDKLVFLPQCFVKKTSCAFRHTTIFLTSPCGKNPAFLTIA